MGLMIGVDLGGSMTRVLVVDGDGRRAGYGTAGGGNPVSRGLDATVESLRAAAAVALQDVAADDVVYAVLGLAGVATFGPALTEAIDEVWRTAGLTCARELRPDAEIAFAAGTAETDGFVLIAGTGAVAGHVRDGRVVDFVDGHGWLLGDRGSGFWLGREAVIAALAAGEGSGRPTPLRTSVISALGLDPAVATSAQIARVVYQRPPVALSELAPLVTDAAGGGDPVAIEILDRAAQALLTSLGAAVRTAGSPTALPVVLAGGALIGYPPLNQAVRTGVESLGLVPREARASAVGAAALAIRTATGAPLNSSARAELLGEPQVAEVPTIAVPHARDRSRVDAAGPPVEMGPSQLG